MRLVSYQGTAGPRIAGVHEGQYIDLTAADASLPTTMKSLLAAGPEALERARIAVTRGKAVDSRSLKLLAPVPDPQKIICVGLNYADHAREQNKESPTEPILFAKLPSAVTAHGEPIVLPSVAHEVDYEAEMVVVLGKSGRNIARGEAMSYVAGYCVGHDVSARDWQLRKPGGQWMLGKSFDTFAPLGPELVTADEVPDPGKLAIALRLNGQTMQQSNTDQLIFTIPVLIEYISQVCTLHPGDLIFTGTPGGVGAARKPPVFLKPGDTVEVEIEQLGVLRNPVVAA